MKNQRHILSFPALWVALAALFVGLPAAHAIDPDLPYSSQSTGLDGPLTFRSIPVDGRQAHGFAYDAERKQTVMFGGYSPGYLADTWVLDSAGRDWVKKNPANSPIGRYGHKMAYDSVRKVVVLFGGYRDANLDETWTWDGSNWTKLNPANSPGGRYYHSLAFDEARGKLILYGGNAAGSGGSETWSWDGVNWTKLAPAASPGNQNGQDMVYDAVRQKIVMFTPNRQTWTWDGVNWANVSPLVQPSGRDNLRMAYDQIRQRTVLFAGAGSNETWLWDGSAWTQASPVNIPGGRDFHALAYDSQRQSVILYGGRIYNVDAYASDTWFWNGTDWALTSDKVQTFDISGRPDGIFHYTTIDVPPAITVRFKRNSLNTPVRWLARGDVTIRGSVDVSGGFGANSLDLGTVAPGGPGGFDGGRGGIRYDQSSSFSGTPGQGPGGGKAGSNIGEYGSDGDYAGSNGYGNPFIQPLEGGSGGGGGGSNNGSNGGNGGGGGGAILIDSSRDISVTGAIYADGGDYQYSGASYGGRGSGGAILLRADRISGGGKLEAVGATRGSPNGRIRLEAFFRLFTGDVLPVSVNSNPIAGPELTQLPVLTVTRVANIIVPQPPGGNQLAPDVVFNSTSPLNIVVTAQNVPDGSPIRLRLTTKDGIVTSGPVFLTGGSASFNLTVPSGIGSIQAFADFRTGN